MEWEEDDAGLRKKSLVTEGCKGKEKVIGDEGICSKGNKVDVTIYKRVMVNGKTKMIEDIGVVKREKERGVVIEDSGYKKGHWKQKNRRKMGEVCADDELQTKKIIKFRLGGRAHNLTLLEFARRLGLYHADELEEDSFNVYFEEGLRSDEHFNTQEYWLSISREENLGLSRSHISTIKSPILRVIHKMITYGLCQMTTGYNKIQKYDLWHLSMFDARHKNGYANVAWLIARWMKRKGVDTQKESQICYGQFISKIARKSRVLTDDVLRSLSALIYFRDLDTTMLRDLIDSKTKLIREDPQPGVPRVGIPRPTRASMQDLYDRIGRIRQESIE
nr:hypothetical protein [Tanacetum cinerariifolium]